MLPPYPRPSAGTTGSCCLAPKPARLLRRAQRNAASPALSSASPHHRRQPAIARPAPHGLTPVPSAHGARLIPEDIPAPRYAATAGLTAKFCPGASVPPLFSPVAGISSGRGQPRAAASRRR